MAAPLSRFDPALKDRLLPGGRECVERAMAVHGLNVSALALRLGISRKHASNLLGGRVPMSDEVTERLAEVLEVDPEILGMMRHDGVIVSGPLPSVPTGRIRILGDLHVPIEGWFEDG